MISALAIPLSAMPTFAFMQWMDFTLNQITLLALSLVAGVLVDDAIVEIENIVRHMRMGKSGFKAALDAADEIGLAVVATSFSIIAVFLPVSFMGGIVGQFFRQFGLTVAVAVFISLMVARLITPVLAAYSLSGDSMPHIAGDGPDHDAVPVGVALVRGESLEDRFSLAFVYRCRSVAVRLARAVDVHAARGFRQRAAADRAASRRDARGYRARLRRCGRRAPQVAPSDQHRRVRRIERWVDSECRHLCEPGAARPALDEPEAMGAAHDASAQPGARRAA